MKTLRFWVIALAVIMLSSCGGKEKITKENGVEILSEVLGYPYIITTTDNYTVDARGEGAVFLEQKKIIEKGIKVGSRSELGFPYFADYDSLSYYVPQHLGVSECGSKKGKLLKLCGAFILAQESIETIDNISEESDDGKITIQFTLNRNLSQFYGAYVNTHTRNRNRISKVLDGYVNVSAVLQRSDDGWMVIERNDLKQQLIYGDTKERYYFRAYEVEDFFYVEDVLNYYEIAAG